MKVVRIEERAARYSREGRTAPPLHSVAILALSVVVLALSLGAALLGGGRDSLYAVPGEPEAAAPLRVVAAR